MLLQLGDVAFIPLGCEVFLQDAVAETPGGAVGFEEVAGGHFVEEMDEAEGQGTGTVELPAVTSASTKYSSWLFL